MELTKYSELQHGMKVTCKIFEIEIEDGTISIDPGGWAFICQNQYPGNRANELFGYEYSYFFACKNSDKFDWDRDVSNIYTLD